jgi:hypothetical protein
MTSGNHQQREPTKTNNNASGTRGVFELLNGM